MREADVIPKIMKHVRDVRRETCAVEVKICHGKSLPFSVLAEHQERALLLASGEGIYHKIADGAVGGVLPFDAFCLVGVPAYIAVWWTRERRATLIPITAWITEKERCGRESITFSRALYIHSTLH